MPIDYKKYPKNWKTKIIPRILKRAENKCEFCGLENHSEIFSLKIYLQAENGRYGFRQIWFRDKRDAEKHKHLGTLKTVKVVLTIAHLDHDETNINISDNRLKALCQQCHLIYDGKEKMRRIMSKNT